MAIRNKQIFHDAFYCDGRDSQASFSYDNGHFFSYQTEVGYLLNITYPVLLVADGYFSTTTQQTIGMLKAACPHDIIEVDFYREDDFRGKTPKQIVSVLRTRMFERLKQTSKRSVWRRKQERDYCRNLWCNYVNMLAVAGFQQNKAERLLYEKLADAMAETPDNLAKWKEERRREAAETRKHNIKKQKKAEKMKREENKRRQLVTSTLDSLELSFDGLMRYAFADTKAVMQLPGTDRSGTHLMYIHEARRRLNDMFKNINAERGLSYVWIDYAYEGHPLRTSQGVTMEQDTVRTAYKAWKSGKINIGKHVGCFTVQDITPMYVRIGCHLVPMENIEFIGRQLGLA